MGNSNARNRRRAEHNAGADESRVRAPPTREPARRAGVFREHAATSRVHVRTKGRPYGHLRTRGATYAPNASQHSYRLRLGAVAVKVVRLSRARVLQKPAPGQQADLRYLSVLSACESETNAPPPRNSLAPPTNRVNSSGRARVICNATCTVVEIAYPPAR